MSGGPYLQTFTNMTS